MAVNHSLLEAHSTFVHHTFGIRETFVSLKAGDGHTVGVLSEPLENPRDTAWLMCHSFATEQMTLLLTDVGLSRRLAAAGFPVLRFQCQGYGDSSDINAHPDPTTHLRDTQDVLEQMPDLVGGRRIGTVGARFGGTIAGLVADHNDLSHTILISPEVSGKAFAKELLRSAVFHDIVGAGGQGETSMEELRRELAEHDEVNIKGFTLTGAMVDELNKIDLTADFERFTGDALLMQITRTDRPHRPLERLDARLSDLGATSTVEIVTDVLASHFGNQHVGWISGDVIGDQLAGLIDRVIDTAVTWAITATNAQGGDR
jgi:pimeloyl-ACP methyl ester carboxylesterase